MIQPPTGFLLQLPKVIGHLQVEPIPRIDLNLKTEIQTAKNAKFREGIRNPGALSSPCFVSVRHRNSLFCFRVFREFRGFIFGIRVHPAPPADKLPALTRPDATRFSWNMKNVTVTVDEDVARWARIWAAKHDTSLSRMLGDELRKKMLAEQHYERAKRRFLAKSPRILKPAGTPYPSRDSLYER